MSHSDTIVAQATPPGRGGVGILRVSGPQAAEVARQVLGKLLNHVMPTTYRLTTVMAACWIRASRYGFLALTPLPARMCWSCKVTAAR